ncbi:MAG: hypothetical protein EOP90_07250 [Lysobacteraceae bacterium]|nr:MAG: hypothetical protein EOP90_07250 [Xanthomonadaceae bacterium]
MRRLTCLFALMPAIAFAEPCAFSAPRDFDVDAAGIQTLVLALESDDIDIEGVAGLERIEVRAKACASSEDRLPDLIVDQQRTGKDFAITSRARPSEFRLFGSSYAYIDFTLRVPERMVVGIRGSSGDAKVRKVAALDFETTSGDLVADAIAGSIGVRTSSGDVHGRGSGSVEIRSTASGDIKLADVRGDVKVARSGSGDLRFADVGGHVDIGSVGSGDVSLQRVTGNVLVGAIGSGDVEAVDIGGALAVRSSGSGDVTHRDVRGKVSVPDDE